jgi:hypothetical protein
VVALRPAGLELGAAAAAALIQAYPQSDRGLPATYAEMLAMRFADCPADQLGRVLNQLIDESADFRPAPGKVKQAVQRAISKRQIWLWRAQAAIRYHQAVLVQGERDARIEADRAAAAARVASGVADSLRPDGDPPPSLHRMRRAPAVREAPKPNHLAPEVLRALRDEAAKKRVQSAATSQARRR